MVCIAVARGLGAPRLLHAQWSLTVVVASYFNSIMSDSYRCLDDTRYVEHEHFTMNLESQQAHRILIVEETKSKYFIVCR